MIIAEECKSCEHYSHDHGCQMLNDCEIYEIIEQEFEYEKWREEHGAELHTVDNSRNSGTDGKTETERT